MFTILAMALAATTVVYVLYRIVERVLLAEPEPELVGIENELTEADRLATKRAQVVRELKDIELDREMGKIDDSDEKRLSRRYRKEWIRLDKSLDEVTGVTKRYLDQVETELQKRRKHATANQVVRSQRVVCSSCGEANPKHAAFCMACGESLGTGVFATPKAKGTA